MKKIIAVCMSIIMFIFIMPVNTEQTVLADTTNEICNDCHEEIYSHDFAQYAATITSECPVCKAEGKILEKQKCFACDGTGKIIESYEQALTSYVILTAFIPMLMGSAGNAGGQASVTIIRSLSLGDIEFKDIGKVIWKEFRVALLCGFTLSAVM